jgi:RND superfamily putative drug exporter
MKLLGDRNWYLPSWLEWLPEVHIEGMATPPPATPSPVTGTLEVEPEAELVPVG